jgi:hypothetical protein
MKRCIMDAVESVVIAAAISISLVVNWFTEPKICRANLLWCMLLSFVAGVTWR